MTNKVLILHSGGLDSTVCLLMALEKNFEVMSLGIDYDQHHKIELKYASAICWERNIPRKVLTVKWDKPVREFPVGRKKPEIGKQISSAFLPARNVVFLSLAFAQASGMDIDEIWTGINAIDFSGYPDCTEKFVATYRKMIETAIPNGPKLVAPLMNMTKPQIAQEAKRLGLNKDDTWSCYRPQKTKKGLKICGKCDACVLHEYAYREIG